MYHAINVQHVKNSGQLVQSRIALQNPSRQHLGKRLARYL